MFYDLTFRHIYYETKPSFKCLSPICSLLCNCSCYTKVQTNFQTPFRLKWILHISVPSCNCFVYCVSSWRSGNTCQLLTQKWKLQTKQELLSENVWCILCEMVARTWWIINLWRKSDRRLDFERNYEMEDYFMWKATVILVDIAV